ncbi:MAG: ribonuclease III [Nitrospirae bacterium]|nr:ribonuclease III [Magnetococcales bacterium]HAT50991.1 ribonuclease III [Alphaproteobacteria bacterium]
MKLANDPFVDDNAEPIDLLLTLEETLGYHFSDRTLLRLALTHRSAPRPSDPEQSPGQSAETVDGVMVNGHNERLELLGDSVLNLAVSTLLYHRFPKAPEGLLSTWRSSLVNTRTLGGVGVELGLGDLLEMGKGEERSGGRTKPSILGNGIEALFGAIYLDGGYEAALKVTQSILSSRMENLKEGRWNKDSKTVLQEKLQGSGLPLPRYRVVEVSGAPHDRNFQVECLVGGQESGIGSGRSKRHAEQAAAEQMLLMLEKSEGG